MFGSSLQTQWQDGSDIFELEWSGIEAAAGPIIIIDAVRKNTKKFAIEKCETILKDIEKYIEKISNW